MNEVVRHMGQLERTNYVRKADPDQNYWFDFSFRQMQKKEGAFGSEFFLIIYGSPDKDDDYFVIPFGVVKSVFTEDNLAEAQEGDNRIRWIGNIRQNQLRITHSNTEFDIAEYHGNLRLLEKAMAGTMRHWWVNQNQTFTAEFAGGYIWSPKRNKNGARNQFYENMRSVAPGDLIFSFRDALIANVGRAISYCYDAPKPEEFGASGAQWDQNGWKVDIDYTQLNTPIHPKSHIDRIRPLLPPKYSPLQDTGDGLQSVYLAAVPVDMAKLLLQLIKDAGNDIHVEVPHTTEANHREQVIAAFEDALETSIVASQDIPNTEKEQIIKARRGQGRFRENVQLHEHQCRITGVTHAEFLIASHIKPWRVATHQERLDGENGLLLCPNIDFLFDRGFISFADDGSLLISPTSDVECFRRLGVPVDEPVNVGAFSPKQKEYLSHHRRNIFLEAGRDG